MSFPGDHLIENHQNVRGYGAQDYTVRQAYEDGKFIFSTCAY